MSPSTAAGVAAIAGVLIAIQTVIIGGFGKGLHPLTAATWIHLGGLIFGVIAVSALGLGFQVDVVRAAPWGLLAGVAGVGIVTTIGIAIGPLGVGTTLAIVTGSQLVVSFALDAVGVGGDRVPLDPLRVFGALMIVAGVLLIFGRSTST